MQKQNQLKHAMVILAMTLVMAPSAFADAPPAGTKTSAAPATVSEAHTALFNDIEQLIKEYYSKVKISKQAKSIHFEHKVRTFLAPITQRPEKGPDLGGIICNLEVVPGPYAGKEKLPKQFNEHFHSVLIMAPYSKPANCHLMARIEFAPDAAPEFLEKFRALVNSYDQPGEPSTPAPDASSSLPNEPAKSSTAATASANESSGAPQATSTSTDPAATTQRATACDTTPEAPSSAATPSRTISDTAHSATTKSNPASEASETPRQSTNMSAEKEVPAATKVDFGGSKLSRLSFPEGRFSVMLPGVSEPKYQTKNGIRLVDYHYSDVHGAYSVSYGILPGVPRDTTLLLQKLSESLPSSVEGKVLQRLPIKLQGEYPGVQLYVKIKKDDPRLADEDVTGCVRIFVVNRFIYIVGTIGRRDWVNSAISTQFLNSLAVRPERSAQDEMFAHMRASLRQTSSFNSTPGKFGSALPASSFSSPTFSGRSNYTSGSSTTGRSNYTRGSYSSGTSNYTSGSYHRPNH